MEEVAVMMPSVLNNDELSDETESINLDLHVSDTEDSTESLKKCEVETNEHIESEEDILNKYVEDVPNKAADIRKESDKDESVPTLPNGTLENEDEKYKKCNGTISPIDNLEDEGEDDLDKTLVNEKDDDLDGGLLKEKEEDRDTKSEDAPGSTDNTLEDVQDAQVEKSKEQEIKKDDETKSEGNSESATCCTSAGSDRTDSDEKTHSEESELEKTCAKRKDACEEKKDACDKSDNASDIVEESSNKKTNESKTDNDNEDDLLCVMDEKSIEEANENKDENSCSASEKDDETKENEENNEESNEENNEESTEETKDEDETEENQESQMDTDMDSNECAMDIEESDIGGVVYTEQNRDIRNDLNDSENKIEADVDANKENEHDGDVTLTEPSVNTEENGVTTYILTNGHSEKDSLENDVIVQDYSEGDNETLKKSTKRQLSDSSIEGESPKKIKLQTEELEKTPEKEKRTIKLLDSFKKFMLDKKLKTLTRFELEELCMQKMCECIVNKSEIGELRQKIMIQEQTIDTWRKEAIVVAKQTRDLKIVHERLMADLRAMKEQTGKPLVPVKITRSVGLQAIIENPPRIRPPPVVNSTTPLQQKSPVVNQQQNRTVPTSQVRQPYKPKASPQRANSNNTTPNRPLQPITQKDNVNNAKPRQIVSSPQQNKKNADPKAVIDLTDEDEKNQTAKQTTNTASPTVRVLNKQNVSTSKSGTTTANTQASKIMFVSPSVLPRNSAVMVKMNSNGLVSPQNGLTTIPNGQVSVVTTPVVRTVSQVRVPMSSVTNVRTASPAKTVYKHPAPLPAAPIYQTSLTGKKPIPPKPHLNLTRSSCGTGIVLQWKMPYKLDTYETIVSYQLYAYQETKSPPKTDNWGKIGDVKALELPMAVTLTQFAVGNRYFFAVRAVDGQKRLGPFSDPENILL